MFYSRSNKLNITNEIVDSYLTLNLLTTTIVAPPSNDSKWQMGFNSAFKGLIVKLKVKQSRYRPRVAQRVPGS